MGGEGVEDEVEEKIKDGDGGGGGGTVVEPEAQFLTGVLLSLLHLLLHLSSILCFLSSLLPTPNLLPYFFL